MTHFEYQMAERTDAELLKIVNEEPYDYVVEAVAAAKAELSRRNLSSQHVLELRKEIKAEQVSALKRANKPLDTDEKLFILLFPFSGLFVFRALILESKGYTQKAKDARRWRAYGLALYCGFFFFLKLLL